jgi:hypothetical protein
MEEILELEEIWALIRKLYGKKKEGWSASIGMSKNNLFDFLIKGPDAVIEIVQDPPYPLMLENISLLPRPWRPLGKGVVLDVDPQKIPSVIGAYGLRPVEKQTFEGLMKVLDMIYRGEKREEIAKAYNRILREHIKTPVVSYEEIYSPIVSIGPFNYQPSLIDISSNQRKPREKLEAEVIKMQRKE